VSEHTPINIPPYYDRPKEAGEVWTLHEGTRVGTCHLWTHPMGGEARVEVDGQWQRGEARRDGLALVELALEWKVQFARKAGRERWSHLTTWS
jgi:hypothetical protein